MDIELYEPPLFLPRVSQALVVKALDDARSVRPQRVHRTVALAVAHGSDQTARLRLERLARAVMATDSRITSPEDVWAADWTQVSVEALEALERGIRATWRSPATRNAMRDSVRAILRESLNAGLLKHDEVTPRLYAMRPEKAPRDDEKQSRGHVPAARVKDVFHELAADKSPTARRDAALIALLVGAGLRRTEAVSLDLADLDDFCETALVHGKGGAIREVPLAPGVRRAVQQWLETRGTEPGPLLTPLTSTKPRSARVSQRMLSQSVAQVVARRFGPGVGPHDLRRTFTGDLLDSGADLSVVSKVLGHVSPATTAGYDRRGFSARRTAVDRLEVPFEQHR